MVNKKIVPMSFSDDLFKHVDPVQWQANVTIPSLTLHILILHSGKLGSSLEINSSCPCVGWLDDILRPPTTHTHRKRWILPNLWQWQDSEIMEPPQGTNGQDLQGAGRRSLWCRCVSLSCFYSYKGWWARDYWLAAIWKCKVEIVVALYPGCMAGKKHSLGTRLKL